MSTENKEKSIFEIFQIDAGNYRTKVEDVDIRDLSYAFYLIISQNEGFREVIGAALEGYLAQKYEENLAKVVVTLFRPSMQKNKK